MNAGQQSFAGADAPERHPERGEGPLFLLPSALFGRQGPVAAWISTAAWANAARRLWGSSWILTPEGVLSPDEVETLASSPVTAGHRDRSLRARLPAVVKTAAKDVRNIIRARRFSAAALSDGGWSAANLAFVWQRHEPFQTAGIEVSRALGKPLVLFVPAPVVWEARLWGVRRPGWGRLVESYGERPQFRSADLVACGSRRVAELIAAHGVSGERILVTPTGVDSELFCPLPGENSLRAQLGLEGCFVVGWSGSFRRFHGVEMALAAVAEAQRSIDNVALLLVGDGPERLRMERLCRKLGIRHSVFTGMVQHQEMPRYLAIMDVALLLDAGQGEFHYSPLKLWEYMGCGKAIIAPSLDQLTEMVRGGSDAVLVDPDDPLAMADAVVQLSNDEQLRADLGQAARRRAVEKGPWEARLRAVQQALDGRAAS